MNANKIAHYLPVFHDMLRRLGAEPGRDLVSLMENQLRAEVLTGEGRRHSITLRDFDNPTEVFNFVGMPTNDHLTDFVPGRVFAWAEKQMPAALPDEVRWLLPQVGWQARLQAAPLSRSGAPGQPVPAAGPSVYAERLVSNAEATVLARGVRAYQAKRRKRARRLLAQLWAYHWQQERVSHQFVTVEAAAAAEGRQVA